MLILAAGSAMAAPATPAGNRIATLVIQLGNDNFRQRDLATRELDAIGEPALDALHVAAKSSDMEVAERARLLVTRIEARLENARLIAPSFVELKFKQTPVEQAIAELAKNSGCTIVLDGDKSKLAERRVTLETGKITFWHALQLLCDKAGLSESNDRGTQTTVPGRGGAAAPPPVGGFGPARLRQVVNQQIVLVDVVARPIPHHIEGAVRIRPSVDPALADRFGVPPQGEIQLVLEGRTESKIPLRQFLGVRIDSAVDEFGQRLTQNLVAVPDMSNNAAEIINGGFRRPLAQPGSLRNLNQPNSDVVPVRLKFEKQPRLIKELRGSAALAIRTPPEVLITVPNLLKAKGESVEGKYNSRLKIVGVTKHEDGSVQLEVELKYPSDVQPFSQIPLSTPRLALNGIGLELVDAAGRPFPEVEVFQARRTNGGAERFISVSLAFSPDQNQAEAAALKFKGTRSATVDVPFCLKDVKLK